MQPVIHLSVNSTYDRSIKVYILVAITALFAVLNIAVVQTDIADTSTYYYYIDSIYFFREPDWWRFEFLSKVGMIAIRDFTGSTEETVYLLRYVLIFSFAIAMYFLFRRSSWKALAVALALTAPLLGLVTIRATPAYIMAAMAAMAAMRGQWRTIAYVLAGSLFHVSTVLAAPAIIAALLLKKYDVRRVRPKYILGSAAIMLILYATLGIYITQIATDFIGSFSYLQKYVAYIPEVKAAAAVSSGSSLVAHYTLLSATVMLGLFLILASKDDQGVEKLFIAISLFIYVVLFFLFDPIASSRYAPFFTLPALALVDIPLRKGWSQAAGALIAVLGGALFFLGVDYVIV
jgi:hypothetical protein